MTDILAARGILGAAHPRNAASLVNLYAARPSLHVAWTAWCAAGLGMRATSRPSRLLAHGRCPVRARDGRLAVDGRGPAGGAHAHRHPARSCAAAVIVYRVTGNWAVGATRAVRAAARDRRLRRGQLHPDPRHGSARPADTEDSTAKPTIG
jgi:hypothetical protein